MGGRPILHEPNSARTSRHGSGTPWSRTFESHAADQSRCWCSRASTSDLVRSAPHVGPQHSPCQIRTARRVLRGRPADTPRGGERAQVQVGDTTRREIHRELCLLHGRCEELGSENGKIMQQLAPNYAHRLDKTVAGLVKHNRRNRRLRGEVGSRLLIPIAPRK